MRDPNELNREELVAIVARIRDALYLDEDEGVHDPSKPWDGDTIEAVAQAIIDAGLRPEAAPRERDRTSDEDG